MFDGRVIADFASLSKYFVAVVVIFILVKCAVTLVGTVLEMLELLSLST